MPNTTGDYPMPYPNSSAVPDVPGDILLLAEAVDDALSGIVTVPARRQLDTTNDSGVFLIQHGVGKIVGNNTATITEVVTFPTAFAVVPIVIVTTAGGRTAGSFNMTGLSSASSAIPSQSGVTTSQFDVALRAFTGTLASTTDWYYTWVAFGVAA